MEDFTLRENVGVIALGQKPVRLFATQVLVPILKIPLATEPTVLSRKKLGEDYVMLCKDCGVRETVWSRGSHGELAAYHAGMALSGNMRMK